MLENINKRTTKIKKKKESKNVNWKKSNWQLDKSNHVERAAFRFTFARH